MTSSIVGGGQESVSKFFETLQADLKLLAGETKKKYPQIKEVLLVFSFPVYLHFWQVFVKMENIQVL